MFITKDTDVTIPSEATKCTPCRTNDFLCGLTSIEIGAPGSRTGTNALSSTLTSFSYLGIFDSHVSQIIMQSKVKLIVNIKYMG